MNKVIISSVLGAVALTAVGAISAIGAYSMGFDKGYDIANKKNHSIVHGKVQKKNYNKSAPTLSRVDSAQLHNAKVGHADIDVKSVDYISKVSESIVKNYEMCKESKGDCAAKLKSMQETIRVLEARCEQGTEQACTISSSMKKNLEVG
jgi:hypothetical protein